MGTYGMVWAVAFVCGPSVGMLVFSASPVLLWSLCGVLGLLAAGIISAEPGKQPLLAGGRVVLAPRETVRDPAALGRLIRSSGITLMQATPSLWQAIVIIMAVSLISLGPRPGAVIALSIPLTIALVLPVMEFTSIGVMQSAIARAAACFMPSVICRARTSSAPRKIPGNASTLLIWLG